MQYLSQTKYTNYHLKCILNSDCDSSTHYSCVPFNKDHIPTARLLTLKELDFCTFFPGFCRRHKTGVKTGPRLTLEAFAYVHEHAEITHIHLTNVLMHNTNAA